MLWKKICPSRSPAPQHHYNVLDAWITFSLSCSGSLGFLSTWIDFLLEHSHPQIFRDILQPILCPPHFLSSAIPPELRWKVCRDSSPALFARLPNVGPLLHSSAFLICVCVYLEMQSVQNGERSCIAWFTPQMCIILAVLDSLTPEIIHEVFLFQFCSPCLTVLFGPFSKPLCCV